MRALTVEEVAVREDLAARLGEIRRHLHRHPELSFQEYQTAAYIASCLEEWGIPYRRMGETGIVVDIVGEKGEGAHIGIRADIDALPIEEMTGLPYASAHPGVMHACGHDGHTAILLGTAYQLHRCKNRWAGRVRCIFQPGEEADGAAQRMIEQGVLENPRVEGMLALHLWPHLPHGTVGVRYGAITAACDEFVIAIEGQGGHSARPHQGVDAIAISAQVIQGLSLLVAKENNPIDPVVVHVGKIKGGSARNAIADRVVLEGTVRTVSAQTREKLKNRLIRMTESIAASFGGNAKVEYLTGHAPVINDEQMTRLLEQRAAEFLGPDAIQLLKEPSMGADDFGAFAEAVPSTYFRLGIGQQGQPVHDLHHPQFQIDDSILPIGVNVLVWTVLGKLKQGVETGC
mgnify:CR=1 FL=1